MAEVLSRLFFAGFVRLHVLYHAVQEPICGVDIVAELARHGYRLSQGTLYPTLHQMEQLGYLRGHRRMVDGRWRNYYRATPAGRKVLDEARQKLQELVAEVIEDQDAPFQSMRQKRNRTT